MNRMMNTMVGSMAMLAAGCFGVLAPTATFVQLNAPPHALAPRPLDSVELFSGSAPPRPFVEIGLVDSEAHTTWEQDTALLMHKLRERAALAGCDALYNLRSHDRPFGDAGVFRGFQASCIVYRSTPAAAEPAANGVMTVERSQLTKDGELATAARFVPSVLDGRPNGFRVHRIRPDSVIAKMGMQDGDLIKRVNGMEISTPDQALAAYTQLKDAEHLSVQLERRSAEVTLEYRIR